SVDAIAGLNEGRCTLAGFHVSQQAGLGHLAQRAYQPLLQPGRHKIIGFAERSQGLMVARGNPLRLASIADVARSGAQFVNRALGSGTRVLGEQLLEQAGVAPSAIRGWDSSEPSHSAVAQAVAAGAADAGL